MVYVIAQLSDIHIGGPHKGSGERFSAALTEINDMARQPDLVLLTGDNTHNNTSDEWAEVKDRLGALNAPWVAITNRRSRPVSGGWTVWVSRVANSLKKSCEVTSMS